VWRKYHFGLSKWYEIYTVSSYDQIIIKCQFSAQGNTVCECHIQFCFLDQIGQLQSNPIKSWSISLQTSQDGSPSYPKPPRHLILTLSLLCSSQRCGQVCYSKLPVTTPIQTQLLLSIYHLIRNVAWRDYPLDIIWRRVGRGNAMATWWSRGWHASQRAPVMRPLGLVRFLLSRAT
jgi:hypothetical protein